MLPVLSHIHSENNLHFWITTDKVVGLGFEINSCDIEVENTLTFTEKLKSILKTIPVNATLRFKTESHSSNMAPKGLYRSEAVSALGLRDRRSFLLIDIKEGLNILKILQKPKTNSANAYAQLQGLAHELKAQGIIKRNLLNHEVQEIFERGSQDWTFRKGQIKKGNESYSVLRLLKQSPESYEIEAISERLASLELDFEITTSVRRLSEVIVKAKLERRMKQAASGKAATDHVQKENLTAALVHNFKTGAQVFEFELLIVVKHKNSKDESVQNIVSSLKPWGDFKLETIGVAPSFAATLPGGNQHVSLLEFEQSLPGYLPLWSLSGPPRTQSFLPASLLLHRRDHGVFGFNLFSPEYDSYNSLVIGPSGSGKSVLTGALTRSILHDPRIQVIKLDVGGSHSKECELFGGTEYQLKLNEPSGINPFEICHIVTASLAEKVGVLSKFLSVLVLETGETQFSKSMRSEIESAVSTYIESKPLEPSLQSFYDEIKIFPRRELLGRWVSGGLYASAFAAKVDNLSEEQIGSLNSARAKQARTKTDSALTNEERLRYFNFSHIFQAADPEFAQAGVAAVLAQFNTEALTNSDRRIVLICDEVPFFIKICFDFFKFTTANVRKFGHAVMLICQHSGDLIVNGDTGLIENSPQRFLFAVDGSEDEFKQRFSLNDLQIQRMKKKFKNGKRFLLQNASEVRTVDLILTFKEYWELTSSSQDRAKLQALMKNVPNLKLEEAIACLSIA